MDFGFLMGVVVGTILRPTIKSVMTVLGTYSSRILLGLFYYTLGSYPDLINATLDIFWYDDDGDLNYSIDSLVEDRWTSFVFLNPFQALQIRNAFATTTVDNPLPNLWVIRPRARWKKKLAHTTAANAARRRVTNSPRFSPAVKSILCVERPTLAGQRARRARIYARCNSKLVGMVSQWTTNKGAMDQASGIPHDTVRFVAALTAEKGIPGRDQHFRVMVIQEDWLLNLPETCPKVKNPHLVHRFRTLQYIAEAYKRHPDDFGIVEYKVRKGEVPSQVLRFPTRPPVLEIPAFLPKRNAEELKQAA